MWRHFCLSSPELKPQDIMAGNRKLTRDLAKLAFIAVSR